MTDPTTLDTPPAPDATMAAAVYRLLAARQRMRETTDALAAARAAFEHEFAELFALDRAAKVELTEADEVVRRYAVATFEVTGEKRVYPGVEVRITEKLDYDKAAAVAWAERSEMLPVEKVLDWKAFEKVAKTVQLPFVTRVPVASATIAPDLAAAAVEAA